MILNKGVKPFHVRELQAEFNASERQIQRDLMTLEASGYEFERISRGTYVLAPGQFIPVIHGGKTKCSKKK